MATNCESCGHRTNEVSWKSTDPFAGQGGGRGGGAVFCAFVGRCFSESLAAAS